MQRDEYLVMTEELHQHHWDGELTEDQYKNDLAEITDEYYGHFQSMLGDAGTRPYL